LAHGFFDVLMNLREILADSFRFLGDLAGELRAGFGAVARVATEALDLRFSRSISAAAF